MIGMPGQHHDLVQSDRALTALEAAPNAMLLIDRKGNIQFSNRRAQALFGYQSEELTGQNLEILLPKSCRSSHTHLMASYFANPKARDMGEGRLLSATRKNGSDLPVEVGLSPLQSDGELLVIVAVLDISERINTEKLLADRAKALELSNKALDAFAYAASHDLKSPLRAVDQLASFILEDVGDILPSASLKDFELLQNRVKRMEALLNGLLEYSRVDHMIACVEETTIADTIDSISSLYNADNAFAIDVASGIPNVRFPRAALALIFRNLIMNSIKHHDRDVGKITITGVQDGDMVDIRFTDDGPGIDFQYRTKIFQPLQTLKPRDEVEGSGIGLSLVEKVAGMHGGTIELMAHEGRGARFHLRLPVARQG